MQKKTAKLLLNKVKKDYDKIADEFSDTRQNKWQEFELFLQYIKDNDRLADLGCGNGRFYNFIKDHRQVSYIGIDNNKKLLKKAKTRFPKQNFKEGDLLKLPLETEKYDVAVTIASLHHIPSQELREKAIKEMHRILKKNGILILTVWNLFQKKYKQHIRKSYWRNLFTLGKYEKRGTLIPWGKTGIKRYYYAFKSNELEKLLVKNGFQVLDSQKSNNFIYICRKV